MSLLQGSSKRSDCDENPPWNTNAEDDKRGDGGDVPFLVTHWLDQFGKINDQELPNQVHADAFEKIRRATSQIASAFSTLGVYGTVNPVRNLLAITSRDEDLSSQESLPIALLTILLLDLVVPLALDCCFSLCCQLQTRAINGNSRVMHHMQILVDSGLDFLVAT